ncbi:hypothetical protein OSB04_un000559 [Centaurea solstitialis]|uniref:GAG-pre-integrase domain-containing protein n=1 Tax=Centaurea solstitialis TaxID=347529 RepID=A0AA38S5Z8_9ASTR|nr:hypothetical protein OSB04_un000559 [Centaurea solstitialis]
MLLLHESREESIEPHPDTPLTSSASLYSSTQSAQHGKSKNKFNRGNQGHPQDFFGNLAIWPCSDSTARPSRCASRAIRWCWSSSTVIHDADLISFWLMPAAAMSVHVPQDNNFYMDSGANRHMTFNQGTMHSLTPCNSNFIQRCDNDHHDLYPVLPSSPQSARASANVAVSFHTWHRRLGHPGAVVFQFLMSHKFISCSSKTSSLCHACQSVRFSESDFEFSESEFMFSESPSRYADRFFSNRDSEIRFSELGCGIFSESEIALFRIGKDGFPNQKFRAGKYAFPSLFLRGFDGRVGFRNPRAKSA